MALRHTKSVTCRRSLGAAQPMLDRRTNALPAPRIKGEREPQDTMRLYELHKSDRAWEKTSGHGGPAAVRAWHCC